MFVQVFMSQFASLQQALVQQQQQMLQAMAAGQLSQIGQLNKMLMNNGNVCCLSPLSVTILNAYFVRHT